MKSIIARILQSLLRQAWIRKLGQAVTANTPWLKRKILRFLYNTTNNNAPEKIQHQGLYEARLTQSMNQRKKGTSK